MAATLCQFRAPERLVKTPDSLKKWLESEVIEVFLLSHLLLIIFHLIGLC